MNTYEWTPTDLLRRYSFGYDQKKFFFDKRNLNYITKVENKIYTSIIPLQLKHWKINHCSLLSLLLLFLIANFKITYPLCFQYSWNNLPSLDHNFRFYRNSHISYTSHLSVVYGLVHTQNKMVQHTRWDKYILQDRKSNLLLLSHLQPCPIGRRTGTKSQCWRHATLWFAYCLPWQEWSAFVHV